MAASAMKAGLVAVAILLQLATSCLGLCEISRQHGPLHSQVQTDFNARITQYIYSNRNLFNIGAVLRCACLTGYTTNETCLLSCQGDGSWSMVAECLPVDCGQPPDLENSEPVTPEGTTYGTKAWYSCNDGYVEYENKTFTCNHNGAWASNNNYNNPICVPEPDCGDPPEVEHAAVVFNQTTPGHVAEYTCNSAYRMVGLSKAVCWNTGISRQTKNATSAWAYVPRCELVCRPHPSTAEVATNHKTSGLLPQRQASLLVTTCTGQKCDKTIRYFLQDNDEEIYADMKLFGSEVCVGYKYTLKKSIVFNTYTSSRWPQTTTDILPVQEECRYFCIPYLGGYRVVVTEDVYVNRLIGTPQTTSSRVVKKYATVPVDRGEFGG